MSSVIKQIASALDSLSSRIDSQMPSDEAFSIVNNNWTFPSIGKQDLLLRVAAIKNEIDAHAGGISDADGDALKAFLPRLEYLTGVTVPQIWAGAGQGVPAFMFTLNALEDALRRTFKSDPMQEQALALRRIAGQVRSIETQLAKSSEKVELIGGMIERIESANNTAEELPETLDSLKVARSEVARLLASAQRDAERSAQLKQELSEVWDELKTVNAEAQSVMKKAEQAYAASTSVGLASAFTERSKDLNKSMNFWVFFLVVSLLAGGAIGEARIEKTRMLLENPATSNGVLIANVLITFLALGAPIWFAWLSTKQVGQRFRLSEDYAFKASVSRAYEGFRREAERHGSEMEARVLASALSRIEELPLRLVEGNSFGSPLHEAAKTAFPNGVVEPIKEAVGKLARRSKSIEGNDQ